MRWSVSLCGLAGQNGTSHYLTQWLVLGCGWVIDSSLGVEGVLSGKLGVRGATATLRSYTISLRQIEVLLYLRNVSRVLFYISFHTTKFALYIIQPFTYAYKSSRHVAFKFIKSVFYLSESAEYLIQRFPYENLKRHIFHSLSLLVTQMCYQCNRQERICQSTESDSPLFRPFKLSSPPITLSAGLYIRALC